jgi:hypothetical protein
LHVGLHQCRKGHIWLIKQTIQGFFLFPGLHLSRQRTQRIFRQIRRRFDRSSRSTQIVQLDVPTALLGPALGVQHFLPLHL